MAGPVRDLHSGSFGGGVPNPLHAMASLLAGLHDERGRVTLPRYYDRVLFLKEGGSGPEADLAEQLGAPLVFLGAGLPTDRIHSPNERVLLPMLHRGAEAAAHLWRELAAVRA